jgi:hypothetical protein
MLNANSSQSQTPYPGQQCLIGQSYSSPVFPPPAPVLHKVSLLFFLYLLITLSLGIYHTYRLTGRQRRIQSLEKLFRLNVRQTVYLDRMSMETANSRVYEPIPLLISEPITDTLSHLDIPLGQGGFARDYTVSLSAGDQLVIELKSQRFDTFVSLLAADGSTLGENDDGPDGTTNSWLVVYIPASGNYTVRVQASGKNKAVGPFTLLVTRFRPQAEIQQFF